METSLIQVTTLEADASDEEAISGICKQALREEGRLDVFFANVSHTRWSELLGSNLESSTSLSSFRAGWCGHWKPAEDHHRGDVYEFNEDQCTIVCVPFRYSGSFSMTCLGGRAFLAVKHASEAMEHTNPSRGKDFSGGSIILTSSVAGLRSGAGTVDCEFLSNSADGL